MCIRSLQLKRMLKAKPIDNLLCGRKLPEMTTEAGPTDTRKRQTSGHANIPIDHLETLER
jgi:hypothetical protein